MTNSRSIDGDQRSAARVAGIAYLLSFALVVVVNFVVLGPIVQGTDHAQVARNILAHETIFRIGIAGNLLYFLGVIAVSGSLYVILRPVGANLALFAMLGRIIHGLSWFLATLNLFTALRLLGSDELAHAFGGGNCPRSPDSTSRAMTSTMPDCSSGRWLRPPARGSGSGRDGFRARWPCSASRRVPGVQRVPSSCSLCRNSRGS